PRTRAAAPARPDLGPLAHLDVALVAPRRRRSRVPVRARVAPRRLVRSVPRGEVPVHGEHRDPARLPDAARGRRRGRGRVRAAPRGAPGGTAGASPEALLSAAVGFALLELGQRVTLNAEPYAQARTTMTNEEDALQNAIDANPTDWTGRLVL